MSGDYEQSSGKSVISSLARCPVTIVILAANTVVFLLGFITAKDLSFELGLYPPSVKSGEYYRLITSIFVHADFAHFACNMFVLFSLGQMFESILGHVRMIVIYLLSGLGGSMAVFFFEDEFTVTVGASGAIFGIIGALLVYMLRQKRYDLAKHIVIGLLINLAITFTSESISVGGHVGGLISGLLLGLILCGRNSGERTRTF